jgi:hypothetical protein
MDERIYYAKLTPYNGQVHAEIYKKYDETINTIVMDKYFGMLIFRNSPRDKDYKKAKDWLHKNMRKIHENTETKVIPTWL